MQYGLPYEQRNMLFAMTPALDALTWTQIEVDAVPRGSETQSPSVSIKASGERALSISTLSVSVLHANLNLTDAQTTQIHTIHDELRQHRRKLMAPLEDTLETTATLDAMRSRFKKMSEYTRQASCAIENVLTPEQRERLPEFLQEAQMFLDAGLPAELIGVFALSELQKQQMVILIHAARQSLRVQIHDALQRGDRSRVRGLLIDSRHSTYETMVSILTPNQKAYLEAFLREHSGQGIHSV